MSGAAGRLRKRPAIVVLEVQRKVPNNGALGGSVQGERTNFTGVVLGWLTGWLENRTILKN